MKKNFYYGVALAALLVLGGCEPAAPSTATTNAKQVEENQLRLQAEIPAPRLNTSLERKNLVERLERINQQNMSGYIYLMSYGRVVSFYPVRGKVTSLNSYLMAGERAVWDGGSTGGGNFTLEQPDYDGAYGENTNGVFFFTADTNAYVEWRGEYLFSDQPLALQMEPMLTREVK
jgi:hypothetical protein